MKKILAVVFVSLIAIVGCRAVAPVYNVEKAPVVSDAGTNVGADQVKKAIIRGGAGLGWMMKPVAAGHIVGTLNLRKHMAKVDIHYDAKSYSIKYKDSVELKYDGTNIHPNYNGWVQNLQRNIDIQLNML
jgi:hypothetical protein